MRNNTSLPFAISSMVASVTVRALAARLSARVSELVMSEQRASAAAEAAARRLAEAQDAHQTEVAALREVARAKEKVSNIDSSIL